MLSGEHSSNFNLNPWIPIRSLNLINFVRLNPILQDNEGGRKAAQIPQRPSPNALSSSAFPASSPGTSTTIRPQICILASSRFHNTLIMASLHCNLQTGRRSRRGEGFDSHIELPTRCSIKNQLLVSGLIGNYLPVFVSSNIDYMQWRRWRMRKTMTIRGVATRMVELKSWRGRRGRGDGRSSWRKVVAGGGRSLGLCCLGRATIVLMMAKSRLQEMWLKMFHKVRSCLLSFEYLCFIANNFNYFIILPM